MSTPFWSFAMIGGPRGRASQSSVDGWGARVDTAGAYVFEQVGLSLRLRWPLRLRSCGLNLLLLLRIVVLRLLGRGERQSAGREGNEEDDVRSSHGALLSFSILPLAQRRSAAPLAILGVTASKE